MNFFNQMENVLNQRKTLTTNGAVAYQTSGKQLLDFNFSLTALRNSDAYTIADKYARVFYEDKMIALKYLFMVGDVREGNGERHIFKTCLEWLALEQPELTKAVLPLIPEYTRWDNLWTLLDTDLKDDVLNLTKVQLNEDAKNMMENKSVSLLAKWLKSEGAYSNETRRLAKITRNGLGMTSKQYRKILSALRKYLDVVEVKMSAKQWDKIKYENVPSRANLIYNSAFLRNDEARRRKYLSALEKGETKINASVLQPHEIVNKYNYTYGDKDTALEAMWKALPNLSVENTLVVRDGSGSMTWHYCSPESRVRPLDVATALAIYMSERNTGCWKDKFITFSRDPRIVNLTNCRTLREKMDVTRRETDCSNTDIYKTMKLILDTAVINHLTQEEMPGTIVIISDMQFDGSKHNMSKSLFDHIAVEFESYGYKLPKICFWNVDCETNGSKINNGCKIPMQQNEMGLILCSAFSVQILKMFMSGKTDPYEVLLEQINSERYKPVEEALGDLIA